MKYTICDMCGNEAEEMERRDIYFPPIRKKGETNSEYEEKVKNALRAAKCSEHCVNTIFCTKCNYAEKNRDEELRNNKDYVFCFCGHKKTEHSLKGCTRKCFCIMKHIRYNYNAGVPEYVSEFRQKDKTTRGVFNG